jgi:acetylornithine deacetylase/succinyl-diaminopimelate desuccinylase family protein
MTPSAAEIRRFVDRDRLVGRLQELVRAESENPPGHEAQAAKIVRAWCEDLALETSEHEAEPGRPSVVARWVGSGGPTLCYCSHIDVVPAGDPTLWDFDPYAAVIEDGAMHGRGTSDAKGPVAAAIEAVAALKAAGFVPAGKLELALVADEEAMGFKGAAYLVDQGIVSPDIAIVGEPTSLRVVHAQRGACWFQIVTRGIAGHGSAPERGVNAIVHMAEVISHLQETLPDVTHPVLGGPSINVGTIRGGEKVNIIAASCIAEVDRRSVPPETEESVTASIQAAVDRARERYPNIEATVELAFYGAPFEVSPDATVVREMARAVEETRSRPPELVGFRGASDARFMSMAGADVIVCGPGDIALAHTARESIRLDELEEAAIAYAVAFARLLDGGSER